MTSTETATIEENFKATLKEARKAGVKVRQNVMICCRSCTGYADFGLTEETAKTTPLLWTFGGQGNSYRWVKGKPYYRELIAKVMRRLGVKDPMWLSDDRLNICAVKGIYVYHDGPELVAATTLVELARAKGLVVEWDGTNGDAVLIKF